MSFVENLRQRLIIGQVSMLLYSALAAVLGKNYKTFLLAFIVIILMSVLLNRRGKNPLGQEKVPPETILSGRKVFEEENIRDIQMRDEGIMRDMQEQSKFTMYSSLGMVAAMIYFITLWKYIDHLHLLFFDYLGNDRLALFLAFLIYFEGIFIINQLFMLWAIKKVGKVTVMQVPQKYTVTDKGIVISGLVGKTTIQFPLPEDTFMNVSEKRGFVELIRHGKRSITKIRFYTKRVKRLEELLKRYGKAKKLE